MTKRKIWRTMIGRCVIHAPRMLEKQIALSKLAARDSHALIQRVPFVWWL